ACERVTSVVGPLDHLDELASEEVRDAHCRVLRRVSAGSFYKGAMTGDQIAALRCPNCGAPAAPESARCEYCHSRLATVSCPKCLGVLFSRSLFCPHCGVARNRVEGTAPASSKCPACKAAMAWISVGAIDLLECGTCDGTWV